VVSKKDEAYFYTKLGYLLKLARVKAKKSQEALAEHLGLSRVTIVNIEKGRQKILVHDLVIAAQFLNASLSELIPSNFESEESQLNLNLKNKINRKFSGNESQVLKVEDFVKLTLSSLSNKDD